MNVTLNSNCRHLEGYPGKLIGFQPPHFIYVIPEGCRLPLKLTPGHVVEEAAVCERFDIQEPVA